MENVFEELINSFRYSSNRIMCIAATHIHSQNRRICCQWGVQIGDSSQFQCINCTKCGGYVKNTRPILISEISCKCHSEPLDALQYYYEYDGDD
jgi:hypothetical protein